MAARHPIVSANRGGRDLYLELVQALPLRPIRSDEEHDRAIAMIDALSDRDALASEERDYLLVLASLIESYEQEREPKPDVSPAEMLRFLIEAKGVTQSKVAADTGVSESSLSEILSGKRGISRNALRAFADYFHVDPGVFF